MSMAQEENQTSDDLVVPQSNTETDELEAWCSVPRPKSIGTTPSHVVSSVDQYQVFDVITQKLVLMNVKTYDPVI